MPEARWACAEAACAPSESCSLVAVSSVEAADSALALSVISLTAPRMVSTTASRLRDRSASSSLPSMATRAVRSLAAKARAARTEVSIRRDRRRASSTAAPPRARAATTAVPSVRALARPAVELAERVASSAYPAMVACNSGIAWSNCR